MKTLSFLINNPLIFVSDQNVSQEEYFKDFNFVQPIQISTYLYIWPIYDILYDILYPVIAEHI